MADREEERNGSLPAPTPEGTGRPGEIPLPPNAIPDRRVTRGSERAILASLVALAVLGFLTLCYFAASVFITLFSSILIALALEPLVLLLERNTRLSRNVSSMIVVILAIGALYGLLYLAYGSASQLLSDLPLLVDQVRNAPLVRGIGERLHGLTEILREAGNTIAPPAQAVPGKEGAIILRDTTSWVDAVLRGLGSLTTILFSLSFIPFLVFFLLSEKEPLIRRTRDLFREEHRESVTATIAVIERMLQRFIIGNAAVAGILCVATVPVFFLVGLPYWLVLGILSGVASTIPYLGLVLALFPPLVVGLVTFRSGAPVLAVAAAVAVLHVVAANYLVPKFVGSGVRLNPVASTVGIMFFGWMWGGMGLVLGIPIVAVLKCVLENMRSTASFGRWLGE